MTTNHPSDVLCPLPRRIERVHVSITSPLVQPSPNGRRVGIRIVTFEACSGFTRVTARRIAQPPKVTFVTRLRSRQLPSETARQLPDLSTIIRVEPSSTDDSRLQGAIPLRDVRRTSSEAPQSTRLGCCSDRAPMTAHAPLRDLRGQLGNWLSWRGLLTFALSKAQASGPSRRRSNWDERLPRWCSARR